jgi:fucose permease
MHGTIHVKSLFTKDKQMKTKKRFTARIGLILLTYIAFIALGLPDGLIGVGWPSIRSGFQIPLDALGALMFVSAAGYLASSFLSGRLITSLGVGGVLSASCALTGMALIGYTLVPVWWMMVALGGATGLGAGAIDAGLNTYVVDNFHEGLMQWLHASYGIGITLGPVMMTIGLNTMNSWRPGYLFVGFFQLALGLSFALTIKVWNQKAKVEEGKPKKISEYKTAYSETLRQPAVWLSILLFILYVGAEISLGTWAYTLLTESRGISTRIAGYLSGSYFATFAIGRILAGFYAKRMGVNLLVKISLLGAILGSVLLWLNLTDVISVIGVALVGLSIAPIFAALVSGTPARVGPRFAANTIGMQISAGSIGAATIPSLVGVAARYISLEAIPASLFFLLISLFMLFLLSNRLADQRELQEFAIIEKATLS